MKILKEIKIVLALTYQQQKTSKPNKNNKNQLKTKI